MLLRILVALVALIVSVPAYGACPLGQSKAVPDCCKTKCPKPVKLQPCFDCVADVRTSADGPEQVAFAVTPLITFEAVLIPNVSLAAVARDQIQDDSYTYLRIGVLRC